jgi:putative NIF3 family GTP cyclohydrolase 1 type 2
MKHEQDASSESQPTNDLPRRKFIATLATGSAVFLAPPLFSMAHAFFKPAPSWTVGQIMDLFISEVPGAPIEKTVDTLKSGKRETVVTGIVTTMFATIAVIRKTIELGANFIIAHEPTFYNHLDETEWLAKDQVYRYKAGLLEKNGIAIWRNHDYIHHHVPDGVFQGTISALGWEKYTIEDNLVSMPPVSLEHLIRQVKSRLQIATVRYEGDLSQPCRKVLLMPGAAGGRRQIEAICTKKPDVLLCGEIQEWETAEYVRDAREKGEKPALVVMGHVPSEEAGSEFMAGWLRQKLPGMPVRHIPSKNPLSFI